MLKRKRHNCITLDCERSLITPDYQVNVLRKLNDDVTIKIKGHVRNEFSKELRDYLQHQSMCNITVRLELSELHFATSSFIAMLIEMMKTLNAHQGELILMNLQSRVMGMIEISKLEDIFHIEPHADAA